VKLRVAQENRGAVDKPSKASEEALKPHDVPPSPPASETEPGIENPPELPAKPPVEASVPTTTLGKDLAKNVAKGIGKSLLFAALGAAFFYGLDKLQLYQLEESIEKAKKFCRSAAKKLHAENPSAQIYLRITIQDADFTQYFPLAGWLPDRQIALFSFAATVDKVDPPQIRKENQTLDFAKLPSLREGLDRVLRSGTTTYTTYTEPFDLTDSATSLP
jgi:hypothetical protein